MSLETRIAALRAEITDSLGDYPGNASLLPLLDAVEEAAVQDEDFEGPEDEPQRQAWRERNERYEAARRAAMSPEEVEIDERIRAAEKAMTERLMESFYGAGASTDEPPTLAAVLARREEAKKE